MSTAATVTLGAVALAIFYIAYFLVGPYVDNWLGFLTRRDFRHFVARTVGGEGLRELVERRAGSCLWSAQHEGYMWKSVVRCVAEDRVFTWEVSNGPPPRPWLSTGVYITPLNRDAATLIPELLPPGFRDLRHIPVCRYDAGVIYDIAQPDEAKRWWESLRVKLALKPITRLPE
jgi:hypothetical protein